MKNLWSILLVAIIVYFISDIGEEPTMEKDMLEFEEVIGMREMARHCDKMAEEFIQHADTSIRKGVFAEHELDGEFWPKLYAAKINVFERLSAQKDIKEQDIGGILCRETVKEYLSMRYGGVDVAGEKYHLSDAEIADALVSTPTPRIMFIELESIASSRSPAP